MKTITPFVWVRLGDADEYNQFDDLAEAAEYMALFGVKHVYRCQKYGMAAKGFTGQNYISLFYGDDETQPTGDFSSMDVRHLNECLLQEERR